MNISRSNFGLKAHIAAICLMGAAPSPFAFAQDPPSANSADEAQYISPLDAVRAGEGRRFRLTLDGYIPPTNWLPRILGGRAVIDARLEPENYSVDSYVSAAGIVDWFVDYSSTLNSRGRVTDNGIRPVYYQALDDEGKKNRQTKITYRSDRVDVEVTPPHGDLGDPPATEDQKLEAFDPMSALVVMAMNPNATANDPCTGIIPIFDGKGRYNLHLSLGPHLENFEAKGWKGPAFVCGVRYEEVAGYEFKTPEEIAAQQHDLKWISIVLADLGPSEPKVPIQIEARSRKRGKVTLVVRDFSFEPLEVDHADTATIEKQG